MPGTEAGSSADRRWLEVTRSAELRAAVDRVIPADAWPGGWEGGVGDYLAEGGAEQRWALDALERLVEMFTQRGFAAAGPDEQDRVLRETAQQQTSGCRLRWHCSGCAGKASTRPGSSAADRRPDQPWPGGLSMIGFREVPDGVTPVEPELPAADAAESAPGAL